MSGPLALVDVDTLYAVLCEALAGLEPRTVADVLRVFLEVSSRPCEERLWSLEFAFDEHDSRVARLEARFLDRGALRPHDADALHGYEVDMTLPKVLPSRPRGGERETTTAGGAGDDALVARFERALADLGAFTTIRTIDLVAVDAYLL